MMLILLVYWGFFTDLVHSFINILCVLKSNAYAQKKDVCVVYLFVYCIFGSTISLGMLQFLSILSVSNWDVLKSPTFGLSICPCSSGSCWFLCFEGIFLGVSHTHALMCAPIHHILDAPTAGPLFPGVSTWWAPCLPSVCQNSLPWPLRVVRSGFCFCLPPFLLTPSSSLPPLLSHKSFDSSEKV